MTSRILSNVCSPILAGAGHLTHEAAHLCVAALFRLHPRITLTGHSLTTRYRSSKSRSVDRLVTVAGPLAQVLWVGAVTRRWGPVPRAVALLTTGARLLYPIPDSDISYLVPNHRYSKSRKILYWVVGTSSLAVCAVTQDWRAVTTVATSYDLYVRELRRASRKLRRATLRLTV